MMLERRVTHKYVGSYQHEDEWECIGSYTILTTQKWTLLDEDEFDPTEPVKTVYTLEVIPNGGVSLEEVTEALKDTFTMSGCHHEYDCCGCRSYYARTPHKPYKTDNGYLYELTVNSYRNY